MACWPSTAATSRPVSNKPKKIEEPPAAVSRGGPFYSPGKILLHSPCQPVMIGGGRRPLPKNLRCIPSAGQPEGAESSPGAVSAAERHPIPKRLCFCRAAGRGMAARRLYCYVKNESQLHPHPYYPRDPHRRDTGDELHPPRLHQDSRPGDHAAAYPGHRGRGPYRPGGRHGAWRRVRAHQLLSMLRHELVWHHAVQHQSGRHLCGLCCPPCIAGPYRRAALPCV